MVNIARGHALPPIKLPTGGCSSLGGNCLVNPSNGNLLLQAAPPAGDAFTFLPVLSYSSTNASTPSEIGNGWSQTFKRTLALAGSSTLNILRGAGRRFVYSGTSSINAFYVPTPGHPP